MGNCKVLITKISIPGMNSILYVRSWSLGASIFTSLSGDFAAYYSKTTMKSLSHLTVSSVVNTIKPQIRFTSHHFLGFAIFDKHVNV